MPQHARLDGPRRIEVPLDEDAIAQVAGVHGVVHRAVEVAVEGDGRGAELDEVEVGVAADQRVERPGDSAQPVVERPRPLVLLEGEADVAAAQPLLDAGDVAVQVGPALVGAEEAEGGADDLVPGTAIEP